MFNRSYHVRSTAKVKAAGGGHAEYAAKDLSLYQPWGGIFEPWRPFILTAQAAEMAARPKKKPVRCKNGRLQGVQLELFLFLETQELTPDMPAQKFTAAGKFTAAANRPRKPRQSGADSEFPPLAGVPLLLDVTDAMESEDQRDRNHEERPLFDLFPEAYE